MPANREEKDTSGSILRRSTPTTTPTQAKSILSYPPSRLPCRHSCWLSRGYQYPECKSPGAVPQEHLWIGTALNSYRGKGSIIFHSL